MSVHPLSPDDDRLANMAEEAVRLLRDLHVDGEVRLRPEGREEIISLPAPAFDLLVRILAHMANGDAVTILPVQAELTTQQAAEVLGISRPSLIQLLEGGSIPHRKVGTHRRVLLADVLAWRRQERERRKTILDELTREAQEMGLDY